MIRAGQIVGFLLLLLLLINTAPAGNIGLLALLFAMIALAGVVAV